MQAECYGGPFRVYSTKEFPGLHASTDLTKASLIPFPPVKLSLTPLRLFNPATREMGCPAEYSRDRTQTPEERRSKEHQSSSICERERKAGYRRPRIRQRCRLNFFQKRKFGFLMNIARRVTPQTDNLFSSQIRRSVVTRGAMDTYTYVA